MLTPRPGLRIPDIADDSSLSVSVFVDCALSFEVWKRSVLIGGRSWSVLRGMLVGLLIGGGDRSRGEIGHRGESLMSGRIAIFCGCGAMMAGSDDEGLRVGMLATDSALCTDALDGTFAAAAALADRDGLGSWEWVFLDRPFPVLTVADLTVGLAGDDSREGFGDAVFDGGCELNILFAPGAGEREGLRLCRGEVFDFEAMPVSVISGAWLGSRSVLSSISILARLNGP